MLKKIESVQPCGEVVQTKPPGREHTLAVSNRNNACSEYKSILGTGPHRPQNLEENRGVLLQVTEREGFAVATFSHGAISLPGDLAARLRALVGKKIGILCLDGYYIRDLSEDHA
jgi:hypothetical protein